MTTLKLEAKQRLSAAGETPLGKKVLALKAELGKFVHVKAINNDGYEGDGGEIYFVGKDDCAVNQEGGFLNSSSLSKLLALMKKYDAKGESVTLGANGETEFVVCYGG